MARRHSEVVKKIFNVLRLGESEDPTSADPDDGATEEIGRGTEVFNFKTFSEGGL